MKKIILILLTVIVLICNSYGQSAETSKPYIEITGTSETEIVPDEIYISITLQERMDSKDKITIDKQEEDLKSNLKEIGVEISDLVLNTANADYRKIKSFKKDVVTSKSYILKVNSALMVDKVYKILDKINAFDAYISKLNHSKITDFTKENRIKAVKAAKDKAEYLLLAVGKGLGEPISIIETNNIVENNPYNGYYGGRYAGNVAQSYNSAGADFSDSGKDDISIKKIKIKASFLVKYEIKTK